MEHCTPTSITLAWSAPPTNPHMHSRIDEFLVLHEPLDIHSGTKPQKLRCTEPRLTITDLPPSTGHSFTLYSGSVSGWSEPSVRVIYFTRPSVPEAPPTVELLKVHTVGALYDIRRKLLILCHISYDSMLFKLLLCIHADLI